MGGLASLLHDSKSNHFNMIQHSMLSEIQINATCLNQLLVASFSSYIGCIHCSCHFVHVLATSSCIGDAKGARNQQKSKLVASSCKVLTSAIKTQEIVKKLCLVMVDRS